MRIELDFADKIDDMYVLQYHNSDGSDTGAVYIKNDVYDWYKSASVGDSSEFIIPVFKSCLKIATITKVLTSSRKMINNISMKIEFEDNILYVPNRVFSKKIKTYSFQTFVDVKIINGIGQIVTHDYRFLKNYNTRVTAKYFIDKYADRFGCFYKKYLIKEDIKYDIVDKTIGIYHGDVIYESEYTFMTGTVGEIAIYTFMIISVENG